MKVQKTPKSKSKYFDWLKFFYIVAIEAITPMMLVTLITNNPTFAQITPDKTLGNENSRVTRDVTVKGSTADLIEGGAVRGSSLFHSFAEFNVNDGKRVYFGNPTGIENIFSRVTGNNVSNILGTLGVNGSANLFLLNPNGILFGKNAQLDIRGSFLATTANSFKFPDGSEFSATNPQVPQLLTMSVPVGVQYGSQPTASITNQDNLVTGKDLTLSAGNLDLQGQLQAGGNLTLQAQDTLKVRDSMSNPFIAAAGGKMVVQGNQKVDIFALNHLNSGFFSGGDMVLRSSNAVGGDAYYWAGGNFRIEQLDSKLGNLFSPNDPVIRAIGDVSFDNYEGASLHILAGGSVTILGHVTITGVDTSNSLQETVTLSDTLPDGTKLITIDGRKEPTLDIRAGVSSSAIGTPEFGQNPLSGFNAQNPTITNKLTNANITIKDSINNTSGSESNSGQIFITNQYMPNGLAGNITTGIISTYGNVTIDSRGDIKTQDYINTSINKYQKEKSTAGSIRLLANQNISVEKDLLSNVNSNQYSKGGDIYLNSKFGQIDIAGNIDSKAPQGLGGDITIKAAGDINVRESIIEASFYKSDSDESATNKYSNIKINSTGGSVYLNGSTLDTSNQGNGHSGDIKISAKDNISILNKSAIYSVGNNGTITIGDTPTPRSITIDNSKINTNSKQRTELAGNILINAIDNISFLNNSKIYSIGDIGLILIGTTSIPQSVTFDHSEINTNSNDISKFAGDIVISAINDIYLNNSKISSQGNFGDIIIDANTVILKNNSSITTKTKQGITGNIIIKVQDLLLLRANSNITTTGVNGNGGEININENAKAGFVIAIPSEDNDIIATGLNGNGGLINIRTNRILGFQNQRKLSSEQLKNIDNNNTSDINASSDTGKDGEVSLDTLSIDPSQGLVALPTNLVDPSGLIAQGCGAGNGGVAKGQSEFVITGRGGLPPSPDDALSAGAVSTNWVNRETNRLSSNEKNPVKAANVMEFSSGGTSPLVEAVGMVRDRNGDIVLTAKPTTATQLHSGLSGTFCSINQKRERKRTNSHN